MTSAMLSAVLHRHRARSMVKIRIGRRGFALFSAGGLMHETL